MLLEDLSNVHYRFAVGDLYFRAEEFNEDNSIVFSVKDAGGLDIGRFLVKFDSDGGNLEFDDIESGTLDRIRRTGESDNIMRQIKKTVSSTF
jgi:hypothetical protein